MKRSPRGEKLYGAWPHGKPTKSCDLCSGTGAKPGAKDAAVNAAYGTPIETCPKCDGRGRVIDWAAVGPQK